MKICEMFYGLQGEGRYVGFPMLFVRFSGCTRKCSFCDTAYHTKANQSITKDKVYSEIRKNRFVCFTGGEPLQQLDSIYEIINAAPDVCYHLETNGDLFKLSDADLFSYISISPKDRDVAKKCSEMFKSYDFRIPYDIKVVTDIDTVGVLMLKYATMLMPLTTSNQKKNTKIRKKVWKYCVQNNIRYCPRLHYEVWGKKRGV